MKKNLDQMIDELLTGNIGSTAKIISLAESESEKHHEIMRRIYPHTGNSMLLGITGPGGAGKSTLTDRLISKYRSLGKSIGVVVVDPSSPFSGGALLGDRIRLQKHFLDPEVFIRSMASRGYLGGLSKATYDVIRIMEAMGKDIVIVETLGAGQDEIDVVHLAHTCLLVSTPGTGDDIQAMKAGIMEIADIIVLNKADLDGANISIRHLENSISAAIFKEDDWIPKVIPTICLADKPSDVKGIDELVEMIEEHQQFLKKTNAIDDKKFKRVEQELSIIFKDELQKVVFTGLRGTGKKKKYINSIIDGHDDPYTVVDKVMKTFVMHKNPA